MDMNSARAFNPTSPSQYGDIVYCADQQGAEPCNSFDLNIPCTFSLYLKFQLIILVLSVCVYIIQLVCGMITTF